MTHTHSSSSPPNLGAPPALIPALERTISRRTFHFFTSNGHDCFQDVSNDRTDYVPNLSPYLPPSTPKMTKAGKIAVHQPYVAKKGTKWWKAQCGFRDLSMGGTIAVLQERLRGYGDKGLGDSILRIRDGMKDDYYKMNDEKLKELWAVSDDSKKAVLWPKKFLYDILHAEPGAKADAVVVRVEDWAEGMEKAAKAMGIAYEIRRLPLEQYPGGKYVSGVRQVILGASEQAVKEKSAELSRELQRANARAKEARLERERSKKEDLDARFSEAASEGKSRKGIWDVSGKWAVSCPYMEEQWGSDSAECTLNIGFTKEESGRTQIWAEFDFIAITGVMRFVNMAARPDPVLKKRSAIDEEEDENGEDEDEEDEDEDEDEPDDDSDDGPVPAQFLFPSSLLPSSKNREFQFRWRGEETGEGEIQLYSDEKLCTLELSSPNAFEGIFESDLTGAVEFRGVKEEMAKGAGQKRKRECGIDINHEWHARNEAAYESARVGRWH